MRIYVACLAAYNNGHLHGVWIDLDGKDAEELQGAINAMLAASPIPGAEEYAIHDYEGFEGIKIEEYQSIDSLVALAEAASGVDDFAAFAAYYNNQGGGDIDDILESFGDAYCGHFEHSHGNTPLENYAEQAAEEMGWIAAMESAGMNASYFDAQSSARDLHCEGYWDHDGHVFRPV